MSATDRLPSQKMESVKGDRIGRFLRGMETGAEYCKKKSARFADIPKLERSLEAHKHLHGIDTLCPEEIGSPALSHSVDIISKGCLRSVGAVSIGCRNPGSTSVSPKYRSTGNRT